jgi:hypothetical protein
VISGSNPVQSIAFSKCGDTDRGSRLPVVTDLDAFRGVLSTHTDAVARRCSPSS